MWSQMHQACLSTWNVAMSSSNLHRLCASYILLGYFSACSISPNSIENRALSNGFPSVPSFVFFVYFRGLK